jgi:hypothetical protein
MPEWKQVKRKLNLNSRKPYISKSGKSVLGHKTEKSKYKRWCIKKFPGGVKKITDEFKNLEEKNIQDEYLF